MLDTTLIHHYRTYRLSFVPSLIITDYFLNLPMLIFILVISFCCAGVLHCCIMCGKCFILILSSSETAATHKSSFFVCLQFILISGLCLLIIVLFLLQKVTLKLKIDLMNMSQIVSVPHLRRFFLRPVPPHDSLHCCAPPPCPLT